MSCYLNVTERSLGYEININREEIISVTGDGKFHWAILIGGVDNW